MAKEIKPDHGAKKYYDNAQPTTRRRSNLMRTTLVGDIEEIDSSSVASKQTSQPNGKQQRRHEGQWQSNQ